MLANNNGKIITRMAKRSLVSNRKRNLILIMAIMLSSFMLFTILTVGATYFRMQKLQDIRLGGMDFDAYIYGGFTEEQMKICEENPHVDVIGTEGMAAWAVETEKDNTLHAIFLWDDDTLWNVLRKPAVEHLEGHYPTKDNELLATKDALKDCGMEELGVGDSFTMTYEDNLGEHTKEFTISGLWEGYGNTDVFYVTRSFFDRSGFTLEDYGRGFLFIRFKDFIVTNRIMQELEESLDLGKKQHLIFASATDMSVQILVGMIGLILITCLSAYLLIYNILYLSVRGNTRYYGLLQTVGMTGRQVYQLMKKQMVLVCAVGMPLGIGSGILVSFAAIPKIVRTFGIREEKIEITFHPLIFLLSIAVTAVTIYLGSRKPAKIAVSVSPVEALGYQPHSGKKNSRRTKKGSLLWRMAREQLSKDKKKTAVVVISLAAGMSVFLCMVTLIESHGPRSIASAYMDSDLVIKNDTVRKEELGEWKPIISSEILEKLRENPAVREVHEMTNTMAVVPWEKDFAEPWMKEMYDMWFGESYEDIAEDYKAHPEKYYAYLTGIDEEEFEYLNSTLENPVDEKEFREGKCCILYRNTLDFDMKKLDGKHVTCYLYGDSKDREHTFDIAGLTDNTYYANLVGTMPTMIVSDTFLKSITAEPVVSQASIRYKEEYDEDLEAEIKAMLDESPGADDFSYESKIDDMKRIRATQGNMMGIGVGIVLILALIGLMNYVNTVSGNIQSRQMELAVMESVGMTEKQVKKMLIREGILFAVSSLVLTATAGLGITYMIYQFMNYMQIPFAVPVLPVLGMSIFILIVCAVIPLAAYRLLTGKKSVVERIRSTE